jgi:hypothetical protein
MLAAGVKVPVKTTGLADVLGYDMPSEYEYVYVANFGDTTLNRVYEATGGNPIAEYDREKLCIVMTPTVEGLSYFKAVYGVPLTVGDLLPDEHTRDMSQEDLDEVIAAEQGRLPVGFRYNAHELCELAAVTVAEHTEQKFEILGAKLSPLTSGKGNIAMFLYFPSGVPFDRQMHLDTESGFTKIRVIPRPVITSMVEPQHGISFCMRFIGVDDNLYSKAFPLIQNAVTSAVKDSSLRFLRLDKRTNEMHGLMQMPSLMTEANSTAVVDALSKINYNPYIYVISTAASIMIE